MIGAQLKEQGIAQTADHNPKMLEHVLIYIKLAREGHLRTRFHDRIFTIEDLIHDFEKCFYKKVPSNLAGSIGSQARRLGYVEEIGHYVKAKDPERHDNKVPILRWALYP